MQSIVKARKIINRNRLQDNRDVTITIQDLKAMKLNTFIDLKKNIVIMAAQMRNLKRKWKIKN